MIFIDSNYEVSRQATIIFGVNYCIVIICAILGFGAFIVGINDVYLACYIIGFVAGLGLAIYLPILFMYKLYQVNEKHGDQNILKVIRKCAILTVFSLISTVIIFVCAILESVNVFEDSYAFNAFWGYMVILDVNTNFLCIMFANKFFNKYYIQICGCLDLCIASYWFEHHEIEEQKLTKHVQDSSRDIEIQKQIK